MTESPEKSGPRSVMELIAESGHRPSASISTATRLAATAQRQRRHNATSRRIGITRSTLLWSLMKVDAAVEESLAKAGVESSALADALNIADDRALEVGEDAAPEPELANAVSEYLIDLPPSSEIGAVDLAWAILSASQRYTQGALPRRLKRLRIDYPAAFAALYQARENQVIPEGSSHGAVDGPGWMHDPPAAPAPGLPSRDIATDRTGWINDGVAETDLLGRGYLAQALASKLRELRKEHNQGSDTGESFVVHVDGPWGSGKSTLFKFLKKELENNHDFLIVEVNAWREQKVGVQWWTLHNALRQAVEKDFVLTGRRFDLGASAPTAQSRSTLWTSACRWVRAKMASRAHVIQTRLFPFLAAVFVVVVALFGLTMMANLDLETGGEIADSIAKIASLLVLGVAGLSAAYRFVLPESHRPARNAVSTSANPMADVVRLFGRTLRRTKKTVVFLVDDLDRCDPEYVVDFLGVLQTLVRDSIRAVSRPTSGRDLTGPYAFIAADGHWIRSSYETHYNSARPAEIIGRPLGYQFLEKIFQLHVRLPSISEATKQAFYESLLKLPTRSNAHSQDQGQLKEEVLTRVQNATTGEDIAKAAEGAKQLTDAAVRLEVLGTAAIRFSETVIDESSRHALAPYGKFLEPNPRSIKLFVNTYNILRSLRIIEGLTSVPTRSLALWAVLEIRWPLLADHLRMHPDAIYEKDVPKAIGELLASAEVRAVIADPEGQLTPNDIRECTGRLT